MAEQERIDGLIALAAEMITLVPDYFRDPRDLDGRLERLAQDRPDEITVTLTRYEAGIVGELNSGQVLIFGHQIRAADSVKAKVRAALEGKDG